MKTNYYLSSSPVSLAESMILGSKYRITVLSEGLLRLEYSEQNNFEDRATQIVLNRDFCKVKFRKIETEDKLEIITSRVHLMYNKKEFSTNGLQIQVLGNLSAYQSLWKYGNEILDLKGTVRTLDEVDGACELDHGLISRNGFSVIDDSKSLILTTDGWIDTRTENTKDLYFFGYGHNYLECLKDFYHLCGKTPMLPRYALGNWWSRFYRYTEQSYKNLILRFEEENIPFSVAVLDMDWHLVDIDPKYGSGWTGYTWNKELFPNPQNFMKWLHGRGMKVTLNVHPASGIRAYEEMYHDFAKELGVNYEQEDPIQFDITNRKFLEAYFKYAHHPNEEMGVDFWWIDWQQGSGSKLEGVDTLWMLNHYHFIDSGRNDKRPMTFSRYAGPGSHRYPVGFSGDSIITWDSLEFQPYFTSNATNIGFGWWSHDIGGHMKGVKNDELAARWLQFGVFSPIMRLHSSCSEFNGKEPWRYGEEIHQMMNKFLRLRHQMIPYLYSMNNKAYSEDLPLIRPMYYHYEEVEEAYSVKNQYFFGTELIVAPITRQTIEQLKVGKVKVWLPIGTYIDIFTGLIYKGNRKINMYRDIHSIPVLAKAGAIIPMTDDISGKDVMSNPQMLHLKIFGGADNQFCLYEDDNESNAYIEGRCVKTVFELQWDSKQRFSINRCEGDFQLIPPKRAYMLEFIGCSRCEAIAYCDEKLIESNQIYNPETNSLCVILPLIETKKNITITFKTPMILCKNDIKNRIFKFLDQAEIAFELKEEINRTICNYHDNLSLIGILNSMNLDADLFGCLCEIIVA